MILLLSDIIILGIIVSIIYYEFTEISPGGMIVPGYIALFLDEPLRILITLSLSIVVMYIVNFLGEYAIIYGKRKFALMIFISFLLRFVFKEGLSNMDFSIAGIAVIGYIVPGIAAQEMDRQGIIKTTSSILIAACIIKLLVLLIERIS